MSIAVITTFPNNCFDVYGKQMIQSFVEFWPNEIPLLINLDDNLLHDQVKQMLRPQDQVATGWENVHADFVNRNAAKESSTDYRKQAVRFCHKVFTIKKVLDAARSDALRYLVWMDADVITTRKVTLDEIRECLPKDGDAVSYLGRKDWEHSECGWLAFDLQNGGEQIIDYMIGGYISDAVFNQEQWHDSWVFDQIFREQPQLKRTNLTADKPGMDIWPHSPMGKWSTHYKGPMAKQQLAMDQQKPAPKPGSNIVIQTKNSLPNEVLQENIRTNQMLIGNWIRPCAQTDEELVVVSAGPLLVAEDVREEVKAGRKIVAVKHALDPLKKAGIKPWACILLDPREHVAGFVTNPDKDVLWFVASQVNPEVTKRLLEAGCTVWGYHASVGAKEEHLTSKQDYAIVHGGSATATRGLYVLGHLGFHNFRLYGYDLSYPDKPQDKNALDHYGQPKYLEVSIGYSHPYCNVKRCFWIEPQLLAQFEEINDIAKTNRFRLKAFGQGIIPFFLKAKETGELRERERNAKLESQKLSSYEKLFGWSSQKKTPLLTRLLRLLPPSLRRQTKSAS